MERTDRAGSRLSSAPEDGSARISIIPPEASSRTVEEIIRARDVDEAANKAYFSAGVLVLALGAWARLGHLRLRSFSFFAVGVALLWTYESVHGWWRLRGAPPDDDPSVQAARAAHLEAVERHRVRLAERPPRLTYALLACLTVASLLQLASIERSVGLAGLVKPAVRAGEWWRLLTGTYLHGGSWHYWMNAGALRALGAEVEADGPRLRLPRVYLVAALAGSVASLLLLPGVPSVGASGGIVGVAAYLGVAAYRRPEDAPPWRRRGLLGSLAVTAYLGIFGFAFVDNAAHAGGAIGGALVGLATLPPGGARPSRARERLLDALGAVAAVVLVAGAVMAVARLLGHA
jgi:membrane associated rhomboid family serine protease